MLIFTVEHTVMLLWAMTRRRWRDSVSGSKATGRTLFVVGRIISGQRSSMPRVLHLAEPAVLHLSALYVVDLVRFRQLAAGVSSSLA
jgi:hypothetical protein